jgi:hypothetical protein
MAALARFMLKSPASRIPRRDFLEESIHA